jgi:hypothetical protein
LTPEEMDKVENAIGRLFEKAVNHDLANHCCIFFCSCIKLQDEVRLNSSREMLFCCPTHP